MGLDVNQMLRTGGVVSGIDLRRALEVQSSRGGLLPRVCHDLGVLDERVWARQLARTLNLTVVDLTQISVDRAARECISDSLLRAHVAFPFQFRGADSRILVVATAEPQDETGRVELRAASGRELKLVVSTYREIEDALERYPRHDQHAQEALLAVSREGERSLSEVELGSAQELNESEPDFVEADLVGFDDGAELDDHTEALRRLADTAARSSLALRAALELCVERGLLRPEDLAGRLVESKARLDR